MNLINDDFILKCQSGTPVLYEDICALYPRTLKDIAEIGYEKFRVYLQIILAKKPVLEDDQNELNALIDSLSNYQYFLLMTQVDQEFNSYAKEAFMFFCHEQVTFSTELAQIIVGPIAEKHIMDEEKFTFFQKMLTRMYFVDNGGQDDIVINENDSERVKKLKRTMLRNREKLARAKAKERQSADGNGLCFSDLIGSFAIGTQQNLNDVYNLTYYAFQDQLKRMGWKEEYNTNTRAAFAGAKIKKEQLVYWIRSIKQ